MEVKRPTGRCGRADRAGPDLLPDPVDRPLGNEPRLPGSVETELFGDLVAVGQVLAAQCETGQPTSLETCGIHERSARVRRFLT
ncbi:hypothetical protein ACFY5F_50740 [Streptomyces sp. NPDC013161]|uniref:hypothetical protein n=1 Tax=Streptomyces sp. NPDC013161 TaxID=3364862 RepID=UPI00369127AE